MLLKSYLAAVVLTFGLASGAHAAAVTINGPHASLDCTTCHANGQFKAPAKETCFQCHQSYQTVAERTAKMNPNPHSNHRGEKDCNACHSMNGKSHFECNDCHNFAIRMKGE